MQRIPPAPGQESVWDYPRPPRVEPTAKHLRVVFNGVVIADTQRGQRVLETSHPPVYYFPPEDVQSQYLVPSPRQTFCEWKGHCAYYHVKVGDRQAENAAWYYPQPTPAFASIRNYIAFYAGLMDKSTVDGVVVIPQAGGFYGGWITPDIVGPFKGAAGTWGW